MTKLLRWLVPGALIHAGLALPPARARVLASAAIVAGNLVPVWSVLRGDLTLGDVFLVYWCENVVFWLVSTVKVATARDSRWSFTVTNPFVFGLHYGAFTAGQGAIAFDLAQQTGVHGGPWQWALTASGIAAGHLVALWLGWFGNGDRDLISGRAVIALPYARLGVLQVGALVGAAMLVEHPDGAGGATLWPVVLLCSGKLVVDVALNLYETLVLAPRREREAGRSALRRPEPARSRPGRHVRVSEE
ncbi:DUF6498-containing protein [Nocardioides sp. MAHUQ-72]|uniref:DUF6498-containing protein n=1 Tax=unclassified Nocardioides TaxID=2615069 RepID=UPI003616C824